MNYVEWLRVRNMLRIVAIVLTILVVVAVILRVSVARYMSPEAWIAHMTLDPGTKVTHTVLPDGTKRMILDDPSNRTHAVIDDRGYAGKHIVITEPAGSSHKNQERVNVGSMQVFESRHGAMKTTVIDTNGAVPMIYYMALADLTGIIVAIILAAPFAREIDGHLEVTLTKPVSRARYALGVIGADVAGILAASTLTIVAFYLCQLLFESPKLDFSGINSRAIAMGIVCPLAWYAMLTAATTWFSRAWIAVLAAALPVAGLIGLLTLVQPVNVVALVVHDVAWVLSRFNPLTYVSMAMPTENGTVSYAGGSDFGFRLSMEIMFFVVYGAIAIWRWQRVEA
jgi:hypothetical protein